VTILGTWLLVFGVAAMLASSCCAANPQDGQAMPGRDVPTLLQALPERARATLVAAASAPTFTGVFENALVERALAAAPELTREALMLGLLPLARSYAVVPTSSYQVGAVAEGQSGALYLGANLEPKGLPLGFTMHAEQSAVAQAHAGAEKAIRRLAITAAPCGYCRQFLNDLVGGAELAIVVAGSGKPAATTLKSLLPDAFGPRDLAVDGALLAHAKWNLRLLEGKHSAAVLSAVEAAARSYSPYTKCPSGVALRAAGGAIVAGSYIENAAYNPSLSPLLAALNLARFRGIAWDGVNEVVLVELQRAVAGSGAISQEQHCRLLAEKLLPKARLQVVRCE
jgi:cytidine deaminase